MQRSFRAAIDSGNVEDRGFYNDRFHALIGEIADNIFLAPSLRRLLIDHARIAETFYRPYETSATQSSYTVITVPTPADGCSGR